MPRSCSRISAMPRATSAIRRAMWRCAGRSGRKPWIRSSASTEAASTTASSSSRTASAPSSPTICCAPISAGSATSCRRSRQLGADFADIDSAAWQPEDKAASIADKKALRTKARAVIASIATAAAKQPNQRADIQELAGDRLRHAGKRADPRLFSDVPRQDRADRSRVKANTEQDLKVISPVASRKGSFRPARRNGSIKTAC